MTEQEGLIILGFLTSGLLVGQVAAWLDGLVAFIRKGR